MARRKAGAGPNLEREVKSIKSLRPPTMPKTAEETEEPTEIRENEEGRETRENEERRSPSSPKGGGYRNKTDVYRKVSYFLTHEQAELIKKEAEFRGQEISAFLKNSKIIESGTPDDLLRIGGLFTQLVQSQQITTN